MSDVKRCLLGRAGYKLGNAHGACLPSKHTLPDSSIRLSKRICAFELYEDYVAIHCRGGDVSPSQFSGIKVCHTTSIHNILYASRFIKLCTDIGTYSQKVVFAPGLYYDFVSARSYRSKFAT